MTEDEKTVVIFSLGSLGDTMASLPAIHLIAKKFPNSQRILLSNSPPTSKVVSAFSLLEGTSLVQGYIEYPGGTRNLLQLIKLIIRIRRLHADVLFYLAASKGIWPLIRDLIFFRICGIRRFLGMPWSRELVRHQFLEEKGLYEHEAQRRVRCLSELGAIDLDNPASWDLELRAEERERVAVILSRWPREKTFFACALGAQIALKDWGEERWQELFSLLAASYAEEGVAFIGSAEERERAQRMQETWPGPSLNLCGSLNPRESAVLISQASFFLGHDSGPMHLAAAVQTPVVAIFTAREKPGVWFPYAKGPQVLYHQTECFGCRLTQCVKERRRCLSSITPTEVFSAIEACRASFSKRFNIKDASL